MKAYGFIELFAGAGWASRCVRNSGVQVASMNIQYYKHDGARKENYMDLCSDAGFGYLIIHRKFILFPPQFQHRVIGNHGWHPKDNIDYTITLIALGFYQTCIITGCRCLGSGFVKHLFDPTKAGSTDDAQRQLWGLHGTDWIGLLLICHRFSWNPPKNAMGTSCTNWCGICGCWQSTCQSVPQLKPSYVPII